MLTTLDGGGHSSTGSSSSCRKANSFVTGMFISEGIDITLVRRFLENKVKEVWSKLQLRRRYIAGVRVRVTRL